MEENAIHPATPAAVPSEAPIEGATLTCRNCRQASPAGSVSASHWKTAAGDRRALPSIM